MKYLVLAIVILSISCKKQSGPVTYPQRLYLAQISSKENVRLFTNKSEIKSSSTITSFIGDSESFQKIASNQITPGTDYIEFLSSDTAFFSTSETFRYHVTKSGNQFVLKSPPVRLWLDEVVRSLKKYPDEVTSFPSFYLESETVVGYENYSTFELCWFAYKIVKHSQTGNYLATGGLKNEFNQNVISTLGANDTLAIQECRMLYK